MIGLAERWSSESGIASALVLLSLCFGVTIAHFVVEPLRWNRCYLPESRSAQLRRNVRDAFFCTALATYLLPFKLGIPLRVFLLRQSGGLAVQILAVLMTLDGLVSLATWSIVTAATAWLAALHWTPPWYIWLIALIAVLICVLLVALRHAVGVRWLSRTRDALALLDRPWRRMGCAATILLADVASYGVRHALIVLLVTGDFKNLLIGGVAGIVATFAGIVSGLPMGLVGYDASLIAVLTLAGIRPEQALMVALINRGLNLASAALLGIPAAMRLGLGSNIGSIIKRFREIGNAQL